VIVGKCADITGLFSIEILQELILSFLIFSSCYAFAATAAVESFYAIKHNILVDFSEQEIVDCSTIYGNGGCDGGLLSSSKIRTFVIN
jgi:hypothetical protein